MRIFKKYLFILHKFFRYWLFIPCLIFNLEHENYKKKIAIYFTQILQILVIYSMFDIQCQSWL